MATLIEKLDLVLQQQIATNIYSNTSQYNDLFGIGKDSKIVNQTSIAEQQAIGANLYTPGNPNLFARGGQFSTGVNLALGSSDIFATAHWLRGIGKEFFGNVQTDQGFAAGTGGVLQSKGFAFLASQFFLSSLNPTDIEVGGILNAVYNPLSIALSAVPGLRATTIPSPNAAAALSVTGDVHRFAVGLTTLIEPAELGERLIRIRSGLYQKSLNVGDVLKGDFYGPGWIGSLARPGETQALGKTAVGMTVEQQVDNENVGVSAARGVDLIKAANALGIETNLYTRGRQYIESTILTQEKIEDLLEKSKTEIETGAKPQHIILSELFRGRRFPGGPEVVHESAHTWSFYPSTEGIFDSGFTSKERSLLESVDVQISKEEVGGVMKEQIDEGNIYMPFMFQDLRDTPEQFLYFRAFLKPDTLTETFTPDWSLEKYYGRVEMIPIYTGTMRIISFSFDVVCWKPDDLLVMWRKLHKLQSLVYPRFDENGFLQSSPIIRMRIGDLFSVAKVEGVTGMVETKGKNGLSWYITSLDFAYDNVWNIKENLKKTRKVTVSLSFTALHEANPGIYPSDVRAGAGISSFGTAFIDNDKFVGNELGVRGVLARVPAQVGSQKNRTSEDGVV